MIDFSYKPTIHGEKVTLRPFQAEDVPVMLGIVKDPEVVQLTGSSSDLDERLVKQWYETRNEPKDRLDLAIIDRRQNVLVGEAVVNEYEERTNSMNFRILIGPRGRNRGLGTEATQLMIDYVFAAKPIDQMTLDVFAFNPRARRVYEKVGFVVERIEKQELEGNGELADSFHMVLTRERWLGLKKR